MIFRETLIAYKLMYKNTICILYFVNDIFSTERN